MPEPSEQEIIEQVRQSPGYKELVSKAGLERAEEYVSYKVWASKKFDSEMRAIVGVVSSTINEALSGEGAEQALAFGLYDAFVYGGLMYREWLGQFVDVLEMERKAKNGDSIEIK